MGVMGVYEKGGPVKDFPLIIRTRCHEFWKPPPPPPKCATRRYDADLILEWGGGGG